jgi:hypothetical protein
LAIFVLSVLLTSTHVLESVSQEDDSGTIRIGPPFHKLPMVEPGFAKESQHPLAVFEGCKPKPCPIPEFADDTTDVSVRVHEDLFTSRCHLAITGLENNHLARYAA